MPPKLASWIALAGIGLILSGCAAVQSGMTGWFGAPDDRGVGKPHARYSAAAGVALRSKPDESSEVVGKLALHEGVLRYQVEGGFAFVTSQKSGRSGWVRERQLIERLPVATKPAAEAPPSAVEEPAEPGEPPPEEAPAEPPEKSIFDPY